MKVILAALTVLLLFAGRADAALVCSPNDDGDGPYVLGDIDNDDSPDLVVGLPAANKVVVQLTGHPAVVLTPASGTTFGADVAVGDLNADGCADVAVGQPFTNQVHIYRGSPTGLATTPDTITGSPNDLFGSSLAIAQRPGTTDHDLYIGAPNRDNGKGAVDFYTVDNTMTATKQTSYTAVNPVAGEVYGSQIAAGEKTLWVGVPNRDAARGAVERIKQGGQRTIFTLKHAKPGDRLGASLTTSFRDLAGAPGRLGNRGSVFDMDTGKEYTQNSPGVPGKAKAGNRFGSSVVSGRAFSCQEESEFAAGVPGDKSVIIVSPGKGCSKRLAPGHGLAKNLKKVGSGGLGIIRYRDDFDEDTYDTLLISARKVGKIVRFVQNKVQATATLGQSGRQVPATIEDGSAFSVTY